MMDPSAPTGFRLFGLGGKEESRKNTAAPAPAQRAAVPAQVSSYAPGSGHIEEELIEEEEFDAPHHHHGKADEHDLDEYEEETLPPSMRTGDLGELLQEAHLDHRIQMNFDGNDDWKMASTKTMRKRLRRVASRLREPATGTRGSARIVADAAAWRARRAARAGRPEQSARRTFAPLDADLRSADHQRPAQAGPGDSGSDCQGAYRQEGRAHYQPHCAAGAVPGVHADGYTRGREPQDCLRRRSASG
jgi:hypothetical protein